MDCRTQLASLAIEELDKGDFLMATKILTTGIRLEPNNHELYFERSICHHKLGDNRASLEDANTAIRLNSAEYNIHYQKGLALIGLSLFPEAVASFKKAIELRAKQEDSKLSDIFKLLRDATNELNAARRRPGATSNQARETGTVPNNQTIISNLAATTSCAPISTDPVDSTTDRSPNGAGSSSMATIHQNAPIEHVVKSSNTNLVPVSRNNHLLNPTNSSQVVGLASRVSSSAHQLINNTSTTINNNVHMSSVNVLPHITGLNPQAPIDVAQGSSNHQEDSSKGSQYEWSIRRSERIFLHHSGEPGTSGPLNESSEMIAHHRQRTGSNPSSLSSGKQVATKRLHESDYHHHTYQPSRATKSKDGTNSHAESDIDVDDSQTPRGGLGTTNNVEHDAGRKRVMIAPSSSMPATSHTNINLGAPKDDSYSSKYKRLRRDRERARRGTSKLCTIKISELEELQRAHTDPEKRYMRVIAPIDGWLYSGKLSVDENCSGDATQYVVRLDGDSTGSSYLFTQETVLNDVIKEVRVKSVSELRKGARICCYWSRTYKCLSTGVVTSRTFEATKSLVSVKYDNGDLSALPLEDLRLLPPDYPKYMSNCDPLLLAKNGDGCQPSAGITQLNGSRVVVDSKSIITDQNISTGSAIDKSTNDAREIGSDDMSHEIVHLDNSKSGRAKLPSTKLIGGGDKESFSMETLDEDADASIPATNDAINFITSETTEESQDELPTDPANGRATLAQDAVQLSKDSQLMTSRASSEENNYSLAYRPWMFDGSPKRSKRHGRTYRDNYSAIRRGNEVLRVGDSAELMPRDESVLPFIAKIDGLWATCRGEMRVRVRWYYRLTETEGEPYELKDGENALFETDHPDENDVQSIFRSTKILSWTEYSRDYMGHVNKSNEGTPKIFYLAGYYDPVRRNKHLRSDVKEAL